MVMVCPTVRPGMFAVLTEDVVAALVACGVAAKTGVSAPDRARSAATIPTAAPSDAIFVLVVFNFFFLDSHKRWNLFIGKERSVYTRRIYAEYYTMKSSKNTLDKMKFAWQTRYLSS